MIRAMPRLRITLFMGILTSLQISSAQRFNVNVVKTPVIVSTGDAANLSCQVSTAESAEHMTIKFHRGDPRSYVYVYNKNPADSGTENEKYKDRTELLTENITRGQVTLRIKNVQLSDIGNYFCFFASSGHYDTGIVELLVAVVGTEPTIPEGYDGELPGPCESSGWYPEPKLQWTDSNGNILESEVSRTFINETNRYKVSSPLPKNAHSVVTCWISNELLNKGQNKSVTIPDSENVIPIVVGSVVPGSVLLAGVVWGIYKKKQGKGSETQTSKNDTCAVEIKPLNEAE